MTNFLSYGNFPGKMTLSKERHSRKMSPPEGKSTYGPTHSSPSERCASGDIPQTDGGDHHLPATRYSRSLSALLTDKSRPGFCEGVELLQLYNPNKAIPLRQLCEDSSLAMLGLSLLLSQGGDQCCASATDPVVPQTVTYLSQCRRQRQSDQQEADGGGDIRVGEFRSMHRRGEPHVH